MKNRAFLLFLLIGPYTAFSLDYTVLQTVYVPPKHFVGDTVELRIRLRAKAEVSVSVPERLPESSWINFHGINVIDRGEEKDVRISFSSFLVGTQTLPAIALGDIVLRDIKIHTETLLPEGRGEFRGPRGQVLLPGTRTVFALTALLAVGGLFFTSFAVRFGKKRLKLVSELYRDGIPYRRLKKAIRGLRTENQKLESREFYIRLLDELRLYMSGKLKVNSLSATTQEIRQYLTDLFGKNRDGFAATFVSLFRQGDRVKFAHETISGAKRLESLDRLQDAVAALEKELRKKVPIHVDV